MIRLAIYVAGPLTGDFQAEIAANIRRARDAYDRLCDMGHMPYCPHTQSGHRARTREELHASGDVDAEYQRWVVENDFHWLDACDAILLLPGWENSRGSRMELARATERNMLIFKNMEEVPHDGTA